jgi:rare lipoprotein A
MRMRKTIGLSLLLVVASTAALAKQTQSAQHQPTACVKAKPTKTANTGRPGAKRQATDRALRSEARAGQHTRQQIAELPPADQHVGPVRVTGAREVGSAAWYGGRHLGRRTASGDRLDALRATAAHRSLPLHSLVRVTNLRNGRSVIARINDRGPVSRNLLIDLSPRAADEIDMKRAGIATVAIEPVAPATNPAANQTARLAQQ